MKALRWGGFLLLAGLLGWRMVAVNLSELSLKRKGETAARDALAWAPNNPLAALQRVLETADADPARAQAMLVEAIEQRPTDGRMFAILALLYEQRGAIPRASQAMRYADALGPDRTAVQLEVAGFWARRGELELYLRHLIRVLNLRKDYQEKLYPTLLALVDKPELAADIRRILMASFAEDDIGWWRNFFLFKVAPYAAHLDSVRSLYRARSEAGPARQDERERLAFQTRLERDGAWTEVYFTWLNALDPVQLEQLGNLFNGGFELPIANEGFGWRVWSPAGVQADTLATAGATGSAALNVRYDHDSEYRSAIGQYLMLPPGRYELSGRVRVDRLRSKEGVRWAIECAVPDSRRLGQTGAFTGSAEWHAFTTRFEVPEQLCNRQQLVLEVADPPAESSAISGGLWFDDLVVRNLEYVEKPSTLVP